MWGVVKHRHPLLSPVENADQYQMFAQRLNIALQFDLLMVVESCLRDQAAGKQDGIRPPSCFFLSSAWAMTGFDHCKPGRGPQPYASKGWP